MKSKLLSQVPAAVFFTIATLTITACTTYAAENAAPTQNSDTEFYNSNWKDPGWPQDGIVMTNLEVELPLSEVAKTLRERSADQFDVLLPGQSETTEKEGKRIEWPNFEVKFQLKNVTAVDVFNAMNIMWKNDKTPLRWELFINGSRPTALLRVLPDLVPAPAKTERMVFFLGDLAGENNGVLATERETIGQVWANAYGRGKDLEQAFQWHEQTQLLVVTGTKDQIQLVQNTIAALKEKAEWNRKKLQKAAPTPEKSNTPPNASK